MSPMYFFDNPKKREPIFIILSLCFLHAQCPTSP